MDMKQEELKQTVELFLKEAERNLVGVYLHGSMAMGCYNPNKSDLDLLVVLRRPESADCYRRIAKRLIEIEAALPQGAAGIELSVILETCLSNFTYPTPFELHYSAAHRDRYRSDEGYLCGGFEDPDLAAHIMITYYRGITLYGRPIEEVFKPIDSRYYVQSILGDVEDASEGILENPVYYTLNLCRVLLFLKEGRISSKQEGGEWGTQALPAQYKDLIWKCLAEYKGTGGLKFKSDPGQLTEFAGFMKREIMKAGEAQYLDQ
ncbi:aminoglycoside adenylyltransferase domain-containing protein [Paenibacillus motobuensis]|uniref:Spectinomycin 9-adenylyltransferase n=1 Tax=Paenibacillus motobuensis TaxID=295324 RepID=A0ABN0Y1G5_9BACL